MSDNSGQPTGGRFRADLPPQESAPVTAKGFKCPNCGGPVKLELPGKSQTVRCPYCSSILEPGHDVLVLRKKYNEKFSHTMWIPLGAEGILEGIKFKCVGMVVRGDDDGGEWCEYLLFNPYHGYRYLVESSGHWTLMEQNPGLAFDGSGRPGWYGPTGKVQIAGKKLKYFTHYRATVKSIIGEFPWQASIGEINDVTEYINPPYAASCETVAQYFDKNGKKVDLEKLLSKHKAKVQQAEDTDDDEELEDDDIDDVSDVIAKHQLTKRITESNWSTGVYKYPEEIQAAFKLEAMPNRVGLGMCEPNPAKTRYLFSLAWTALLFVVTTATCSVVSGRAEHKTVLAKEIKLNTADFELKKEGETDYLEFNFEPGSIELSKETNVEFDFTANLNQQWMSLNVFMIDETTGQGFIYDTEMSHYWGGSGDDAWSEGSDAADFTTQKMPAGNYYVFVAGATNIGVESFKRYLAQYGTRQAAPVLPPTAPINQEKTPEKKKQRQGKAVAEKKAAAAEANPAPASEGAPAPAATNEKRGKLLPEDFPYKASAPQFNLRMKAVRGVVSVAMAWVLILTLFGFNIYYYIRYRSKEAER